MKTTPDALQFDKLTSVAEEERFQKDITAQTDNKFKYFLFFVILWKFKPKMKKLSIYCPSDH